MLEVCSKHWSKRVKPRRVSNNSLIHSIEIPTVIKRLTQLREMVAFQKRQRSEFFRISMDRKKSTQTSNMICFGEEDW